MIYKLNELKELIQIEIEDLDVEVFDIENRRVALTKIGDVEVSTVFLVVDHNPLGDRPVVFETMIFREDNDDNEMYRYCTWKEAEEGHWKIVKNLVDTKNEILEITQEKLRYNLEDLKKKT